MLVINGPVAKQPNTHQEENQFWIRNSPTIAVSEIAQLLLDPLFVLLSFYLG